MDAETFEQIAGHVHQGWAAEKQRQGFADHIWRGGPDPTKNANPYEWCGPTDCGFTEDKHHADMLPYAELAENVKEYARATVRAVLAGIKAAGLKIVPA